MGDPGNVRFKFAEGDIYLYTHWNGSSLKDLVKGAPLTENARRRYDDASYLTRIVIEEVIANAGEYRTETGWGIAPYVGNGKIVTVDLDKQTVDGEPF